MEALHDLVEAGKVRYIGASSMLAWQFAKAACREVQWLDMFRFHRKEIIFSFPIITS